MRYLVLGSSAAGVNGAKEIRKHDPEAEIYLISKDEDIYSRCILHEYVNGKRDMDLLRFVEEDYFDLYDIKHIGGVEVTKVNREEKTVELDNGEILDYDKLLIATGSRSVLPPVKNMDIAKNVIGFRNIDDAIEILENLDHVKDIVIMGGGLVGVDCLSGLLDKGKNLSLLELQDRLLPIQLDKRASKTYERLFEEKGVNFYLGVGASELVLNEDNTIKAVKLSNGEELPCDFMIVAAGVTSNVEFLENSGIEMGPRGLKIDHKGRTNDPDIYGAGDVTGWGPIWPVAVKEGMIAGANIAGGSMEMDDFFTSKSTMNYLTVPTMSLGQANPEDDSYTIEIQDDGENYKKIVHKDGKIYGALVQGDLSYVGILTQLIKEEIDVSRVKKSLFDIDYSDFFHLTKDYAFDYEEA